MSTQEDAKHPPGQYVPNLKVKTEFTPNLGLDLRYPEKTQKS